MNDQNRFEYEVERAMTDWEYRVSVCLHDIDMAFHRLNEEKNRIEAEINNLVGRLDAASRPTQCDNAAKCPF